MCVYVYLCVYVYVCDLCVVVYVHMYVCVVYVCGCVIYLSTLSIARITIIFVRGKQLPREALVKWTVF
jgi:hypothetical protein